MDAVLAGESFVTTTAPDVPISVPGGKADFAIRHWFMCQEHMDGFSTYTVRVDYPDGRSVERRIDFIG